MNPTPDIIPLGQEPWKHGVAPDTLPANFDFATGKPKNTQSTSSLSKSQSSLAQSESLIKKIGSALISSEKRFGESISGAIQPALPSFADYEQSVSGLEEQQSKVLKKIAENRAMGKDVSRLEAALQKIGTAPTHEEVNPALGRTNLQIAGEAGGVALDVLSGGAASAGMKSLKLAKSAETVAKATPMGEAVAKNIFSLPPTTGQKMSEIGKKYVKNALTLGGIGYGYDVAGNLQEGETGAEAVKPGLGTAIGAMIPGLPALKQAVGLSAKPTAERIVNSLVKPLLKDFSYGKNPGRGVASEGIKANTLDDLATQIGERRQQRGQEISNIASQIDAKIDMGATGGIKSARPLQLTDSLKSIDTAMQEAARTNNSTVLKRLEDVKDALLNNLVLGYEEGAPVIVRGGARLLNKSSFSDAFELKKMVGDMTKWTGNPSDDQIVNGALKEVYGNIKGAMEDAAERVDPAAAAKLRSLNERYADLTSAEIAAKYRDKIEMRQNLMRFVPQLTIGSGAIASLFTMNPVPFILALGAAGLEKAFGSTAVKTRIAAWLAHESEPKLNEFFAQNPAIAKVIYNTFSRKFDYDKEITDYAKNIQPGLSIKDVSKDGFQGYQDLTTKFLEYTKGKTTLSRQEILDFARRPELKKGEADLLNKLSQDLPDGKLSAQDFADSIRRDLLELKPVKVKDPQYRSITIQDTTTEPYALSDEKRGAGKNYEEVVFESPIKTDGSSHYPNSKNYFAHARGDEVVEGGKKIWREQEIQSDLLQKDKLEDLMGTKSSGGLTRADIYDRLSKAEQKEYNTLFSKWNEMKWKGGLSKAEEARMDELTAKAKEISGDYFNKLSPFTNDRFGERILRERIKDKASKGYSKFRFPTGETIGKIEGHTTTDWFDSSKFWQSTPKKITPEELKIGQQVMQGEGSEWIITDILGDGRFRAIPKNSIDMNEEALVELGYKSPDDAIRAIEQKKGDIDDLLSQDKETFDLTGKSTPQYRRYENWGKFLKNKYGGKEVTDAQENTWVEIDLTKDMGKVPVEAFGAAPLLIGGGEED